MSNKMQIPDFLAIGTKLMADTRRYAKVYCLQWFDDSFQKQGFTDASFKAWAKRKTPDQRPGGAILIDTTFLRKSLDVISEDNKNIEMGTHVPYASVHNNGERVRAIQYVRAHSRTRNGKREQVKSHSRKIDINFPERQFIGHSKKMMENLDQWVLKEIEKRFKQP
jgi:phage gpG-like protein